MLYRQTAAGTWTFRILKAIGSPPEVTTQTQCIANFKSLFQLGRTTSRYLAT